MSRRLVLCGDIGGTKTLLAIAALDGDRFDVVFERRYADRDFADFADLVRAFRDAAQTPVERACLGIAGPIDGRHVAVTNFPWHIDADALERVLGAPVALANDFVAAANGIDLLRPDEVATLQAGEPEPRGSQVVIGAGTGLGIAYRVWQVERYAVIGGEGGHAGFAPADERQADLWRALHAQLGRVRVEHVVSGPGLARIYDFLRDGGAASGRDRVRRGARRSRSPRSLSRVLRRGRGRPCARGACAWWRVARRRDRPEDSCAAPERAVPRGVQREGRAHGTHGALSGQ